ncbi:MAG TPA: ABC transporter substrate-binding protein [Aggregatilinea sp.]|uniref:ABC transporter substrate-binding protein n=1 Tax=Aggregatilinea sp. TaxID=2806333 RepID=UPI002CEBA43E|nr:ABC transporter substrate-binding protein [Aggregatilinea sp.]HML22856.1 ABC transporter substrate-binding protein [Aggregatilinea sp.]
MPHKRLRSLAIILLVVALTGIGGVLAQSDGKVTFLSTQFNVVEESDTFREILTGFGGEAEFIPSEEGPAIDLLRAESESGEGTTDVIGALHGTFPPLANDDLLFDLTDLLNTIEADYDLNDAYVELGKLGTEDYQYYIPWMQATYVMAANVDALQYLPEGADINALTWDQFAEWSKNIYDQTGEAKVGFPVKGLFHRFLEGYIYPSYTGGMVTGFKSPEAVTMFEFLRDDLWPYVHPQSINYDFMQQPLLSGEVLVAFDHTARLRDAFEQEPDQFVAFPAPSGPAGLGYMPVVVGLGIPYTSPNPDGAEALIQYLSEPSTQGTVLANLGFFPVVAGAEISDLSAGMQKIADAVQSQATTETAIPALLPVGLGERGGEINEIYRNAFTRIIQDGEDIQTVLDEEGASLQSLLDETGAPCWVPDAPSEGPCQLQ